MLTTFRGDALERDGRWPEAEKLYYAAWKEDPTQLHFLYKISTQYWDVDPGLFQQEEKLQKTIFSRYTYLTAYMKTDKSQKYLYNYRPFFVCPCFGAEPGKCACGIFSDKYVIADGGRTGSFAGVRYRLVL